MDCNNLYGLKKRWCSLWLFLTFSGGYGARHSWWFLSMGTLCRHSFARLSKALYFGPFVAPEQYVERVMTLRAMDVSEKEKR